MLNSKTFLYAATALGVGFGLAACGKHNPGSKGMPQMPPQDVGVVTINPQPVEIVTELPGRTSAYRVAEVRPQVGGIIRNRLKVHAAVENAKTILGLQKEFGSFKNWLAHHHPKTKEEWTKLFRKTFRFTGGEIVNEFLMSAGYLPGAHDESCPVYKKVLKAKPTWNER